MPTQEFVPLPTAKVVLAARQETLQDRKAHMPIEAIRALASMQARPLPVLTTVTDSASALLVGAVRYAPGATSAVDMALRWESAGADAVAFFSDDTLYDGGLDDLVLMSRSASIPLISQNYIVDEYQIVEARAAGASALMLYAGMLDTAQLRNLVSATQRNLMTAIVEVQTLDQLDYALSLSPYAIGLSRRDPWTGEGLEDHLAALRAYIPPGPRVMITDPLDTPAQVAEALHLGVQAVTLSDRLLRSPSLMAQVRALGHNAP